MDWVIFGGLALMMLGSAGAVIASRDLVHAVLFLALGLLATAGAYVALNADFLAAVQLMLYAGGVITLMLFAVMLSQRLYGASITISSSTWSRGITAGVGFFALTAWAILKSALPAGPLLVAADTKALGNLFLTRHVAAFEAVSALLLAAMIGAIVLARKKDP